MKNYWNNAISFRQPQNRERDLKATIDGYRRHIKHDFYLAEIFQKDGIQNSWGAKLGKGKEWECIIFYSKKRAKFYDLEIDLEIDSIVGILDRGTTGLTGKIPHAREDTANILGKYSNEIKNQKLAGFLSQDWSTKDFSDLGSRGRGKAIFLYSSQNYFIFFDSLRHDDNQYILGVYFLDKNKDIQIRIIADGELAKKQIKNSLQINPLEKHGTRIFVTNPNPKLVEAIKNQKIDLFIQTTWWEIIHKYQAKIYIIDEGKTRIIKPHPYLPPQNEDDFIKEKYDLIKIQNYGKIKRITFFYSKEKEIPETCKGIFIQRNGMLIEKYSVDRLISTSADLSNYLYGIVEMDKDLEKEMHRIEGPEHYDFDWVSNPAAIVLRILKSYLKKFIETHNIVEKEKTYLTEEQKKIHNAVKEKLNKYAKKLNIHGGIKFSKDNKSSFEKEKNFRIRFSLAKLVFPGETTRVDYGEKIRNIFLTAINETNYDVNVELTIFIKNRPNVLTQRVIKQIGPINKLIKRNTTLEKSDVNIGWEEILIKKEEFKEGRYIIEGKLVILDDIKIENQEKGSVYKRYQTFYVNTDPEGKDIFDIKAKKSSNQKEYIEFEEEGDKIILIYNSQHPLIQEINDQGGRNLEQILTIEGLNYLLLKKLQEEIIDGDKKKTFFSKIDTDYFRNSERVDFCDLFTKILKYKSILTWY